MKLILLNGPPSSGKDYSWTLIRNARNSHYSMRHEKFSFPIKRAFAGMANAHIDNTTGIVDFYESHKEQIIPWLGVSYRQWQIDFSERFLKPIYGENIFARLFLARNETRRFEGGWLCVVTDCGFQVEVNTVVENWPNAKRDVLLLRLRRPGTSFANDSRQWVYRNDDGPEADVVNPGDQTFRANLNQEVSKWLTS